MALFDIQKRVIVVTGALGQLGSQYVQCLLKAGAKVAALDVLPREHAAHEKLKSAIPREQLENFYYIRADVADRSSLSAALVELCKHFGDEPYGLVNNAACDVPPNADAKENGPFEDYSEASFNKVMDVNVKGSFLACQVFGAAMASRRRGSIINVSSIYGVLSPDQSIYDYRRQSGESFFKPVSYSVSKSAVLNLSRYLATYWGRAGVRVNTVVLAGVFNGQDPRFLEKYTAKVPLGRMAKPDEYNGSILYLLSDASSYVTGSTMYIDGGYSAW